MTDKKQESGGMKQMLITSSIMEAFILHQKPLKRNTYDELILNVACLEVMLIHH